MGGLGWFWVVVGCCGWLRLVAMVFGWGGCGWLWLVVGGCGWLWVVVGGFGSFLVLVCTLKIKLEQETRDPHHSTEVEQMELFNKGPMDLETV